MKKFSNRTFQKIIDNDGVLEDILRTEKINKDTYFAIVGNYPTSMPMGGASVWIWSNDIKKLASYLCEFEMRKDFAYKFDLDENDFNQSFIKYVASYMNKNKDHAKENWLAKFYDWLVKFSDKLKGDITFEDLKNLLGEYNQIDVSEFNWELYIKLFSNLEEAIEEYNSLKQFPPIELNSHMSEKELRQEFYDVFYG